MALNTSIVATILESCNQNKLLLGCRFNSSVILTTAAMGYRNDVLHDCGTSTYCTHVANGVGWYFSQEFSRGLVDGPDITIRAPCDGLTFNREYRLCWHTLVTSLDYRCGTNKVIDHDYGAPWERMIYQAD